jgi:hypothetical protein
MSRLTTGIRSEKNSSLGDFVVVRKHTYTNLYSTAVTHFVVEPY